MRLVAPILVVAGVFQALGSAFCPCAVSTGSRACSPLPVGATSREEPKPSGCRNRSARVRASRQCDTGSPCCSHADGGETVSGTVCRHGPAGASHKRFLTPFPHAEAPDAKAEAALQSLQSSGSRCGCRCRLAAAPAAVPSDGRLSLRPATAPTTASVRAPEAWEYLSPSARAKPPPWGPNVPRIDRSIRTTVLLL